MDMKRYLFEDEDLEAIAAPYWIVIYIDIDNTKHLAQIKDKNYLQYLKDNFRIESVNIVS